MQRQLTLTEHTTTEAVALGEAEARYLNDAVTDLSVTPTWGAPGHFDLRPGAVVGVVSLPSVQVVIEPKVPVDRVLFLVSYALDPARWHQHLAVVKETDGLVEGLVAIFAHTLRRALRRGVLQGYRTRDAAMTTLRGRIRFDEQLRRHYGAPLPIEVTYDDFSVDTDMNRYLLAALDAASRLPLRSVVVRSLLASCAASFGESVARVDVDPASSATLRWDRLNDQFRPAVELARLVLDASSVELQAGVARATTFTINMNTVFEVFVRTALREALGLTASELRAPRPPHETLDQARRIDLEPDMTWWDGGRPVFVADAKYKRVQASGIKHTDLYQLLAYVTALDVPAGMLIYAAGETDDVRHVVSQVARTLCVRTIDLEGSPQDILSSVGIVANDFRTLRQSQPARVPMDPEVGRQRIGRP
jgi:5-methylcytosine-specific restriction enzyme subunit McrC